MYIKMNSDKSLIITIPTTIYRGENKADLITFLVPAQYGDINLADCAMMMRYILPDGTGKSEPLSYLPEMYKDYLQFSTVANTRLTADDGEIIVWLTAIGDDGSTVLKTGEAIVPVYPNRDIADYMQPEELDQLDMLAAKVAELEQNAVDTIIFNADDSTIQLSANGSPIGERIYVCTDNSNAVVDVAVSDEGELVVTFEDGTTQNLGAVGNAENVVYVPHVDEHKILTFTIETEATEVPAPVDLNPNDEWSNIDEAVIVSEYVWESM